MSADRLQALKDLIQNAQSAIESVPDDQRENYGADIDRLDQALAYVALTLERTDALLISGPAYSAIEQATTSLIDSPGSAGPSAGSWTDTLLGGVALLPAARDRDLEQGAKDAALRFQQSARQRLNTIESEADALRSGIGELRALLDEKRAEVE